MAAVVKNDIGSIAVAMRPTSNNTSNNEKECNILQPYFELKLFVGDDVDDSVRDLYVNAVEKHNSVVRKCIFEDVGAEFDSGFDLFSPNEHVVMSGSLGYKLNHEVKCSMGKMDNIRKHSKPVGYYLYPRSSTGTKTPLRLSNSVGIIDSGYRGNIIAAFDNRKEMGDGEGFTVERGMRVVQICPPDLSYPILVTLVDNEDDLGITKRGSGGFGSTGL